MSANADPAAPGSLVFTIRDRELVIDMIGGSSWRIPVGPNTIVERQLERAGRPAPEQLTNALGIVSDHLDDVIRESPMVFDTPAVAFAGPHAEALARVELGAAEIPDDYELTRADADEVFRTLVAEPVTERIHNPGLAADHVETIIGTCCVVLATLRRFERTEAAILRGRSHRAADESET